MSENQKASLIKVIFLSASGFFLFVCMDSTAKYLGGVMPVTQVVWGRFFFHFFAICIYFLIFKPKLNLKRNFLVKSQISKKFFHEMMKKHFQIQILISI